ncbi:hypothetical protein SAMN05421751_11282 [Jhaorihella thermophila]|uniref:Uncharacterized protein n=1 Tax=Jhaorihella thermophila TaxID=488547 RepID=A0A1H5XU26_9RHOB|nr:hypothetical protein SAMN05421751_11282 [Jhaorihella thermophila]
MSHYATTWAIRQRGLKPATKLVLWYLADRHNPDYGCFPSQEWTCRAFVPPRVLVYANFPSNATGLFQPSAEWRRRGL